MRLRVDCVCLCVSGARVLPHSEPDCATGGLREHEYVCVLVSSVLSFFVLARPPIVETITQLGV